jgi:predicted O-methyltransferase YrrM
MSEVTFAQSPAGLRRPRYSVLDVVFFSGAVFVVVTTAAWYVCSHYRRQRDDIAAAAFRSDLPVVTLASPGPVLPDDQVYRGKYGFTQNWFTTKIPVWEKSLAPFKGKPGVKYLEVGLYEGRSALWMLENVLTDPTSHLTGIDIFDGELKDRFFDNLRRCGAEGRATVLIGFSQVEMRRLPLESFDIIYIDGSHATADVLEDAVLSYRLLRPGGVLIFDDYVWSGALYTGPLTRDETSDFPKAAIDRFVQCFEGRMSVLHNGSQLIVKKSDDKKS